MVKNTLTQAEIYERFINIERRQPEFKQDIDSILVNQGSQLKKINEIHYLLAGTAYNKQNGGMVGELRKMGEKVKKNTAWRIKISAAGAAVTGIISFFILRFSVIIKTLKELVGAE